MKLLNFCTFVLASSTMLCGGVVTPTPVWQQMVTPGFSGEKLTGSVNNTPNAAAYWNNNTSDGAFCANVGCFITRQSYYTNAPGTAGSVSPNLDNGIWLGNDNGTANLDFSFNGQTGGHATEILVELAGYRNGNWTGWYDTSFVGPYTLDNRGTVWDVIFDGNDSPSYVGGVNSISSKVITPTENFGFWFLTNHTTYQPNDTIYQQAADRLNTPSTKGAMFTQTARNQTYGTSTQYFSLFAESTSALEVSPTKFWVGVEDLREGDFDYNDMIFSFSLVSAVPEPGFYGVLSLGLGGLYLLASRRRKVQ